jgi:hypothetical protein
MLDEFARNWIWAISFATATSSRIKIGRFARFVTSRTGHVTVLAVCDHYRNRNDSKCFGHETAGNGRSSRTNALRRVVGGRSGLLPGLSGILASTPEFMALPFRKTRRLVEPCMEHGTAQSVCPGLANSPRITFAFRSVNGCGIVHPRRSNSVTKSFDNSGNAVGGSRRTGTCVGAAVDQSFVRPSGVAECRRAWRQVQSGQERRR